MSAQFASNIHCPQVTFVEQKELAHWSHAPSLQKNGVGTWSCFTWCFKTLSVLQVSSEPFQSSSYFWSIHWSVSGMRLSSFFISEGLRHCHWIPMTWEKSQGKFRQMKSLQLWSTYFWIMDYLLLFFSLHTLMMTSWCGSVIGTFLKNKKQKKVRKKEIILD